MTNSELADLLDGLVFGLLSSWQASAEDFKHDRISLIVPDAKLAQSCIDAKNEAQHLRESDNDSCIG